MLISCKTFCLIEKFLRIFSDGQIHSIRNHTIEQKKIGFLSQNPITGDMEFNTSHQYILTLYYIGETSLFNMVNSNYKIKNQLRETFGSLFNGELYIELIDVSPVYYNLKKDD
jgi:hypothetical protein